MAQETFNKGDILVGKFEGLGIAKFGRMLDDELMIIFPQKKIR